jgi:hypothetical protein
MCDSLLHLAWESNSTPDYDKKSIHYEWVEYSSTLIHRAIQQKLMVFATGTGLENEDFVSNSNYLIAKKRLRQDVQLEINYGNVSWLQPYFILSRKFQRPRILAEYLKDPSNFQPKNPAKGHDYIFVEDVGLAIDTIIGSKIRGVIEIGSGVNRTNADLINALRFHEKICSFPLPAKPQSRLIHDSRPADISKLRAMGWKPELTSEFFGFASSNK